MGVFNFGTIGRHHFTSITRYCLNTTWYSRVNEMLRTDKAEVTETYQYGLDGFQNTLEPTPAHFNPWAGDLQVELPVSQ